MVGISFLNNTDIIWYRDSMGKKQTNKDYWWYCTN